MMVAFLFPVGYTMRMKYELQSTSTFDKWLTKLKDASVRNRLLARLSRVENGNFGDYKQLSTNLYELRCFFGSGLRVYYTLRNGLVVLLLVGGNKSTQAKDIETATNLLQDLEV